MSTKKIYFGTNLKMYKGNQAVVQYLSELSDFANNLQPEYEITLFVIPSYTTLKDAVSCAQEKTGRLPIKIGAQNMNPNDNGQFTGEISPLMLNELGVQLVMIGHSERRHVMKETDQEENEKVLSALKHGFTTLLCIGETLEQKNYNISDEVLRTQLKIGLQGVSVEQLPSLWIAYEPVWAIGTGGIPATADYADEKHTVIKQCLLELFGEESKKIPVLYGGSVNLENSNELILQPHIDGLFVGRSAWDAENFYQLIINTLDVVSAEEMRSISDENEFSIIARQLINELGGKSNISALTHCATRIRVVLDDETKIDKIAIEKISMVKGIFSITKQFQIIFDKQIIDDIYSELKILLK
ncbi:triose-phosphate isomerase [Testudinibacter aquarius]|uniref:Triosephosphate isomerase n=1 Tax=Testudinibacter aquarius TaxID=1524974 RepID=A0A4R3YFA9_9PAST|nr:triose-phosphate isomerase [Testudinibacter aquarius]KAE9529376.1 triose-phosphate isomerase [Testudinibacter aquarius]TCV89878.1 triosephosphate isomerase [Testudinibacter aquarius]TNG93748.1 triose-phosphate isomerase [Testudinibacter aquarius]